MGGHRSRIKSAGKFHSSGCCCAHESVSRRIMHGNSAAVSEKRVRLISRYLGAARMMIQVDIVCLIKHWLVFKSTEAWVVVQFSLDCIVMRVCNHWRKPPTMMTNDESDCILKSSCRDRLV